MKKQQLITTCLTFAVCALAMLQPASADNDIVLNEFEAGDYGQWKPEGKAFGTAPANGTLHGQMEVRGFQGKGLVNSFLGDDEPTGKHPGELWPEQAVDVMAALGIFTGQNAAALLLGSDLGSLSVGKRASFAVLDRDITAADPATLDATRVLQTWVDGVLRFADAPDSGAD